MRTPLFEHHAKRKTVSVTLNADLLARSTAYGINISCVAEAALMAAFEAAETKKIRDEITDAARFTREAVREYGSLSAFFATQPVPSLTIEMIRPEH